MTDEEVRHFREAAQVLITLLRCVSMKRALAVSENDRLNFFRLYDGCLMDVAVLSWCKIFGSHRSEQLHWERLFPKELSVHSEIKARLLAAVDDFDMLSNKLRNYRDTYVAHHDLEIGKRASCHPRLEPLRASALIVYEEVFSLLEHCGGERGLPNPSQIQGESLRSIEARWREIADAARNGTAGLLEP